MAAQLLGSWASWADAVPTQSRAITAIARMSQLTNWVGIATVAIIIPCPGNIRGNFTTATLGILLSAFLRLKCGAG